MNDDARDPIVPTLPPEVDAAVHAAWDRGDDPCADPVVQEWLAESADAAAVAALLDFDDLLASLRPRRRPRASGAPTRSEATAGRVDRAAGRVLWHRAVAAAAVLVLIFAGAYWIVQVSNRWSEAPERDPDRVAEREREAVGTREPLELRLVDPAALGLPNGYLGLRSFRYEPLREEPDGLLVAPRVHVAAWRSHDGSRLVTSVRSATPRSSP
jgi:hypothetical protein